MSSPLLMGQAIADIATERQRQVEQLGFTRAGDDERNEDGSMAKAAAFYAYVSVIPNPVAAWTRNASVEKVETGYLVNMLRFLWPSHWKSPVLTHPRRQLLVKAAALIVAEIERLDRKEAYKAMIDANRRPDLVKRADPPKSQSFNWPTEDKDCL